MPEYGSCLCALTKTGAVLCWGSHANGALGDGSAWTHIPTPVQAPY